MYRIHSLFSITLLVLTALPAKAQECRDATPVEKQVVSKMVQVLQDQLEAGLIKDGWKLVSERTALPAPQIAKSPGPMRPLMLCNPAFDLDLGADPASGWGKKWQDSVSYYQQSNDAGAQANMFRLLAGGEVFIRASENNPYQHIHISPVGKTDKISVPGVSLALQYHDPREPNKMETTLYFGNWKNARITNGNDAYSTPFPFQHPGASPFIVNLVVKIIAGPAITPRVLAAVDWSKLNDALTP